MNRFITSTNSLGAPLSSSIINLSSWHSARSVVAGRFINCYSSGDWLLALLYRSKSYDMSIAGLGPVHLKGAHIQPNSDTNPIISTSACSSKNVDDDSLYTNEGNESYKVPSSSRAPCLASADEIENVDVSGFISSHSDYPKALPKIFEILRL